MIGNERSAEARGGTVNMRLTIFWIWNLFGESIEGLPLEGPSFELHVYMDLPHQWFSPVKECDKKERSNHWLYMFT